MSKIESPCIKVCVVEHHTGLCLGCARTLSEIASWTAFTDGERSRIMAEIPARLDSLRRQPATSGVS